MLKRKEVKLNTNTIFQYGDFKFKSKSPHSSFVQSESCLGDDLVGFCIFVFLTILETKSSVK